MAELKKIGWWRRLFMGWDSICHYFRDYLDQKVREQEQTINDWKIKHAKLETALANSQQLQQKFEEWQLRSDQTAQQRENDLKEAKKRITRLEQGEGWYDKKIREQEQNINNLENQEKELQTELLAKKAEMKLLEIDIRKKLEPLGKIDRIFFGISANKGKGELGERQLRVILENIAVSDDNFWQENLTVGQKQVEFAIKSGQNDGKWIPVDSKVIEHEADEDNQIIIADDYFKKIKTQASKVSGYLDTKITTKYGILVLQNDEIYLTLWQKNPHFFRQIIDQYKVYILSPSLFVQFAFTLSRLLEVYQKSSAELKIFAQLESLIASILKYNNSIRDAYVTFKTATEKNYRLIFQKRDALMAILPEDDKRQKMLKPKKDAEFIDSFKENSGS